VIPPINDYRSTDTYNSFSIGVDIETGGHVFTIMLTNSVAMIEKGFIAERMEKWKEGEFTWDSTFQEFLPSIDPFPEFFVIIFIQNTTKNENTILIIIALTAIFASVNAQKLVSKNSHIWFFSHTPMEDIEGHNRQAVSILDPATGDLVFNLLVKSFEFKVALMQEHFNENYMESDKFPKAAFKGKLTTMPLLIIRKTACILQSNR